VEIGVPLAAHRAVIAGVRVRQPPDAVRRGPAHRPVFFPGGRPLRRDVAVQECLRDAGLGADLAVAVALAVQEPGVVDLVGGVRQGRPTWRPLASATLRACAARSAVKMRSISANSASIRNAMRPMPASAVLTGSGSARERTPMSALGEVVYEVEDVADVAAEPDIAGMVAANNELVAACRRLHGPDYQHFVQGYLKA
jgi:hypothetical protein